MTPEHKEFFKKGTGLPWPLTIISDRYGGVYSGAKFLAFNLYRDNIPEAIGGDDPMEMEFWDKDHGKFWIGKGETPNDAVIDLMRQASDIA